MRHPAALWLLLCCVIVALSDSLCAMNVSSGGVVTAASVLPLSVSIVEYGSDLQSNTAEW